ncbi:MAG TPA: LamG domain-containing protein [Hanamia sp.]
MVCLLLVSSLQSFSQVNLNAGLMAYYPFSGNANDASGNGNNPIFNNATLTPDRLGNPNSAYSFNGTDNYIRIPNSASLNSSNQISICAWVKVAGFYQGTCHGNNIVMKGDADYQLGDYKIRFDDSYFTNSQNCSISNPDITHETFFGINSTLSSNTPFIQTNQWYSVVYTSDGTTAKIYVNCKLVGSGPANGITFTNGDDLFLGSMNNAQYPYWFNGAMDEIRIYNRPLNEDEIKAYGDCSTSTLSCSNWLSTPARYSYVDIGKLDVTGNQITVEAVINRTTPYVYGTGDGTEGDVVSKHDNPTDVNYLLRPNHAYITTTNGFFATPDIPDLNLNETYHIAMVYDGDTLKFYRNGCLMSKIAASGDLFQNSWDTRIGYYQNQIWNTNFIGYINEVRIWNVARTQAEIQTYMNTSLPNPTTQPGLLAYYTFDSLINKQGNPSWNGTLGGSASINQANTNCNSIDNLCVVSCNINITKSPDTSLCGSSPVKIFASGGSAYSWVPTTGLSDPNIANPVATPLSTTQYFVTVTKDSGCSKIDSVTISVNSLPVITKSNDTSICINSSASLLVGGGTSYLWSPAATLNGNNIANPVATPTATTTYNVEVTNANGCSKTDSITVGVKPVAVITISNDSTICNKTSVQLIVSGGSSYIWSPSSSLNNPASSTPDASPLATTLYHVNITDANSCAYNDSVKITVRPPAVFSV